MTISVFNGKAASLCASYLRVMANMLFALGFHAHPLARGGSIAITLLLSNYHGKTTRQGATAKKESEACISVHAMGDYQIDLHDTTPLLL